MTGVLVSGIIVIITFILFFVLSFKGMNLFAVILLASALVCLALPGGLSNMFGSFMDGTVGFIKNFCLVYTLGGAYGYCLMESKLGASVARHLIKVFGKKNAPVVLFVITCLLVVAGVQSYQFTILAIGLPLLKELNLPKKVALAAMSAGGGSVVYGILVGMPNPLNLAPTTYLGTTTMAGVVMSLICAAFAVAFIVIYLKWLTRSCIKKGQGFTAHPDDIIAKEDDELPPVWKGYICLLSVVVLSLIFQFVFGIPGIHSCVYAILISIVVCRLLVGKKWLPNTLATCVKGFTGAAIPHLMVSFVVGYGAVVQSTEAFKYVVQKILTLNIHPYLLTFIAVNLLAGMMANGIGGVNAFYSTLGPTLMANPAVNLEALHRISTIAGCGFDSLPHNGAIGFQLAVFKLSYKEGYFQQFMMSVLVNLLAGLLAVLIGILLY